MKKVFSTICGFFPIYPKMPIKFPIPRAPGLVPKMAVTALITLFGQNMPFYVKISGRANFFGNVVNLELSIKVHCVIYRLIRKIYRNQYAKKKKLSVTHSFSLGCSSVIQYSRNLIWPRSIFFIFNV